MELYYESEEKLKDAPKFCTKCGAKLSHDKTADGYDPKTGAERFETTVVCPNGKKWYQFGHSYEEYTANDLRIKTMHVPLY